MTMPYLGRVRELDRRKEAYERDIYEREAYMLSIYKITTV